MLAWELSGSVKQDSLEDQLKPQVSQIARRIEATWMALKQNP